MKFLPMLFLLSASSVYSADLSVESTETRSATVLAADFSNATAPSESELKLGRKWSCQFFSAIPDDYSRSEPMLSFEVWRKSIHGVLWRSERGDLVPYNVDFGSMSFDVSGLVGLNSDRYVFSQFTVIRKFNDQLLIEQSGILKTRYAGDPYWKDVFSRTPLAVYDSKMRALNYARCEELH